MITNMAGGMIAIDYNFRPELLREYGLCHRQPRPCTLHSTCSRKVTPT
jgi:hypothetical protein